MTKLGGTWRLGHGAPRREKEKAKSPHRLRFVRPPLSGAVKVSRFGFTEGSGWFELLAPLQLGSEARDHLPALPQRSWLLHPARGRVGKVLESLPATMALGKAGRRESFPGLRGSLCSPQWSGRWLGPIPLLGGNPGSPNPAYVLSKSFFQGVPMPLSSSAAYWPAKEEVFREASPLAAGPGGQPPSCPQPVPGGEGQC